MVQTLCSLVFACDAHSRLLTSVLDGPHVVVSSPAECAKAVLARQPTLAFVDVDWLPAVQGELANVTVIAIVEGVLEAIVDAFNAFPQLEHVITTALLSSPQAMTHLAALRTRLAEADEPLEADATYRATYIMQSGDRDAQLEQIREFFATHVESARRIGVIKDIAEELVTNALYDAPSEAGYFPTAVSRTVDVEFPLELASELSYGIEARGAFVRMRDPFGALTRGRILGVLNRCSTTEVEFDETRGGAGLGLWRVFTNAATLSITVIPGRLTDILVWIDTKKSSRASAKQLLAAHLYMPADHPDYRMHDPFARAEDDELNYEAFTLDKDA